MQVVYSCRLRCDWLVTDGEESGQAAVGQKPFLVAVFTWSIQVVNHTARPATVEYRYGNYQSWLA